MDDNGSEESVKILNCLHLLWRPCSCFGKSVSTNRSENAIYKISVYLLIRNEEFCFQQKDFYHSWNIPPNAYSREISHCE